MEAFTLDTSGYVDTPPDTWRGRTATVRTRWSDLDAITQGYIEALLQSASKRIVTDNGVVCLFYDFGFSDLSPEALAMILRDCEAYLRLRNLRPDDVSAEHGRAVWKWRQEGGLAPHLPPLTAYLGDDGKVYLREAA